MRKLRVDLETRRPVRWITSGRLGMASCSLFWTFAQARSGSVPGSKVRVSEADPAASLVDDM